MEVVGGNKISAVVVNWNGRTYLAECLDSLLEQQPPPAEILVVDNHSDDGSAAFVTERYPEVRVIDTGRNGGPGLARNVGVAAAREERVLLVDNDVVLQPGALSSLGCSLEEHPDAGMIQARSLCHDDPEIVHYDAADLHYLGLMILHNWFRPRADATRPTGPVGCGVALCMLTTKEHVAAVGGFNEDLFFFYEDADFAWKLRILGFTVWLDPDALVLHRGGTAGLSMRGAGATVPPRRTYYHSRNRWLILLTCLRWRSLLLLLPAQLLYSAVHFCFAVSCGHTWPWIKGKLGLLRMLPRIPGWRRPIQAARRMRDRDLLCCAPLTLNPGIAEAGMKAALRRSLDRVFYLHWRMVRRLCG